MPEHHVSTADTPIGSSSQPRVDPTVFWLSLAVIVGICIPLVLNPQQGVAILERVLDFTTSQMGWVYLWFAVAAFVLLVWLSLGKYGGLRLGLPHDRPEFSTPSWMAMLFCAGIGSSVLYWGTIEWAYYFLEPPFGAKPRSMVAGDWGATYGMFHWGFSAWAIYCVPTLPVAYALHRRRKPVLRLSEACRGVLGRLVDGPAGKVIDLFFMFGLVGGVGTSLGLGTPLLAEGFSEMAGTERTFGLDLLVVVFWTAAFGLSVYLGLEKGIKRLSNTNIYLAGVLAAFVLATGPTVFIIKTFTNSVGLLLQNFVRMSFYTDPIVRSGFPEKWTIFYWAWWIAFAPFMGLFVARISRGRTIRELIVAECVAGSLGCWLVFAILGNTGLYFELHNVVPVTRILGESGGPAAIVAIIKALPAGSATLAVFLALAFIFLTTSLDSAAFTLAAVATKGMKDGDQPRRWHRVFWAVVLGGFSVSLMYLGGLKALQTSAVVAAFPLVFVLGLMAVSFLRWLREDERRDSEAR